MTIIPHHGAPRWPRQPDKVRIAGAQQWAPISKREKMHSSSSWRHWSLEIWVESSDPTCDPVVSTKCCRPKLGILDPGENYETNTHAQDRECGCRTTWCNPFPIILTPRPRNLGWVLERFIFLVELGFKRSVRVSQSITSGATSGWFLEFWAPPKTLHCSQSPVTGKSPWWPGLPLRSETWSIIHIYI